MLGIIYNSTILFLSMIMILLISLNQSWRKLISVEEVKRGWETALINLKNELSTLPLKLSARFASVNDEDKIHDDFIKELDNICNRLVRAEEEATIPESDRLKNV